MDGWGFFIFLWFGMGIMGSVLGAIVSKVIAGFFLGFFLGPIGWIIVFLLPRDQELKEVSAAKKTEPRKRTDRPERNLESNAYRFWLGKTYNIQKNELFEKYEYDNDLFDTLKEALLGADQKDCEKEEIEEQSRIRYQKGNSSVDRMLVLAVAIIALLVFSTFLNNFFTS